ncbi:lamin tail domain-containing protein [Haloarchaeobius baliensis]|uniref:lamin tail domain-containing protein n=1 Tax=Haloarchaeobius baliensis TaxID=1670458 RepID=UPI003F885CE0
MSRGSVAVLVLLVVSSGCLAAPDATGAPVTSDEPTTVAGSVNGTLEVHFIAVGQSASALVITPAGETVLVDSGDWRDDGEIVIDYLQRQGIERIDHLVTSHADADHIGGHAAVIEYFETEGEGVGAVYDPGIASSSATYDRYLDAVEEYDVPLFRTRAGTQLPIEGVDVAVLGPPQEPLANVDRNENSIVLRIAHGNTSVLLPGDAGVVEEQYLVSTYGDGLRSTVLLAGHHGSRSSTGTELLDAVQPRVTVISSAYSSQYGHPHEEVLERLATRSIPTYWTGVHGDVVVRSDGRTVTVLTQQSATTVATALRDEPAVDPGSGDSVAVREQFVAGSGERVVPITSDGGTSTSVAGQLSLAAVHADAAGNDNENLNDEYLTFENTGDSELDLGGWVLADAAGHRYTFPSVTLAPGEQVTVYTGSGTDGEGELYWGAEGAIWNNGGDTVLVTTDEGTVVVREEYA